MSRNTPFIGQSTKEISWAQVTELVTKLASRIQDYTKKEVLIYGVPRGGVIPATMLTHQIKNSRLVLDPYNITIPERSRLVIVDDIIDSGYTLKGFTAAFPTAMTYTLFYRWGTGPTPNYFGEGVADEWLVFPWEVKA